jgi:hypothetical protein
MNLRSAPQQSFTRPCSSEKRQRMSDENFKIHLRRGKAKLLVLVPELCDLKVGESVTLQGEEWTVHEIQS